MSAKRRAATVKPPTPTGPRLGTYWVTRDSTSEGVLVDTLCVWIRKPVRHRRLTPGGGAYYLDEHGGVTLRHCEWPLAFGVSEIRGAVPQSDLECVRVGRGTADELMPLPELEHVLT